MNRGRAIRLEAAAVVLALLTCLLAAWPQDPVAGEDPVYQPADDTALPAETAVADGVRRNGQLRVQEGQLVNSRGLPIQLRGMSSHGLAWFPEYTSFEAIATTREYGANLFRAAMYADSSYDGYNFSAESAQINKSALYAAVENALAADMYVIADWHLLEDQNPLVQVESAVAFFEELSIHYAGNPGVLYEICNEPNGETTWEDIRLYADQVIPVIRANAPNAVILVGTPEFCTDLWSVMDRPLDYENVLYSFHYYSGISRDGYRTVLDHAKDVELPVFVTEWGISNSEDTGMLETGYARDFILYMKENNLSWANWSLCNKDEEFSAIRPDVDLLSGWSWEHLSESGRIVFEALGAS